MALVPDMLASLAAPRRVIRALHLGERREARALRPDKSIVLSDDEIVDLNRWIESHMVVFSAGVAREADSQSR